MAILDIPWEDSQYLRKKYRDLKPRGGSLFTFPGPSLPRELALYKTEDFSYARWIEDEENVKNKKPLTLTKKGKVIFKPRPHQLEAAKAIFKAHQTGYAGFLLGDKTGLGKGVAASTLIPTPQGFTTMGSLKIGDIIYSPDGKETKVIDKTLSQAKKFYEITFSDGTKVKADEDHRWVTSSFLERKRLFSKNKNGKGKVIKYRLTNDQFTNLMDFLKEAESKRLAVSFYQCSIILEGKGSFLRELLKDVPTVDINMFQGLGKINGNAKFYHPTEIIEKLNNTDLSVKNRWGNDVRTRTVKTTKEIVESLHVGNRNNHTINNTKPLINKDKALPVDPYILGVWLGDGHTNNPAITSMDEEIIDYISAQYPITRIKEELNNKSDTYFFSSLGKDLAKIYGPLQSPKNNVTKHIPNDYLFASYSQRLELLKGLLDTDGSISAGSGSGVTFSQKNKDLFFQVYALVCSFGWKCTWRIKTVSINDSDFRDYYELLFFPDVQVFNLTRKKNILNNRLENIKNNYLRHKNRVIVDIQEITKEEDYYCISVDSAEHMYLITESMLPTHNTLGSLVGICAIAKKEGFTPKGKAKLLIVCPKGVIPVWRQNLHNFPTATALCRVMIINYQQLNKLLTAPAEAANAKKKRTKNKRTAKKGVPTVDWDYIIFDEAHYLKNYPSSSMSVAAANIARLNDPYIKGKSPFVIYSTATPGSTPLNFALMAPWLSKLINNRATNEDCTPMGWGDFLMKEGFAVKKGKLSYSWATIPWYGKNSDNPKERAKFELAQKQTKILQRQDTKRIGMALKKTGAPFIMRSPTDIAGWPEQQIIPLPLELSAKARPIYEEAWSVFRSWLNLPHKSSDSQEALVQRLRYRQKASLLKVDATMETVIEFLENDNQVFIGLEFIESLERYKELLEAKGIKVSEISGRNVKERENERIKFQKGITKVVLCTVPAGISLHAGETLPDGTQATSNPRITILADIRENPLNSVQMLGRAHRNGVNSITYVPYFEDTVEEMVTFSFVNKTSNMNTMLGDSDAAVAEWEELFMNASSKY